MNFYEADLEKIIMQSDPKILAERGLYFNHSLVKSQLRIGNYGIADIVAYDRRSYHIVNGDRISYEPAKITIYELKKDEITVSAFFQAVRYAKGIMRWMEINKGLSFGDYTITIRLIGKATPKSDVLYLPDMTMDCPFSVELFKYNFDINGLLFKDLFGYKLINEGLGHED